MKNLELIAAVQNQKKNASDFRTARKALGLSMVEAARTSRVPYRTWQSWELAEVPLPPHAITLLEHLSCSGLIAEERLVVKMRALLDKLIRKRNGPVKL